MGKWNNGTIATTCQNLDKLRIPISGTERSSIQGDIPYYGANGQVGYIDDFIFDEPLILIAEDGGNFEQYETRPIAYRINGKSWVNNHAHILRALPAYDQDYIFYSLEHKNVLYYIAGGTRSKLTQKELSKIEIVYPEDIKEQQKIAQVLTTVDEAISKTKGIIEKYNSIKIGLMQDLLANGIDENGVIRSRKTHKYKDSPLGIIPVEWECVELIEWSTKQSDSIVDGPFGSNLKLVHYRSAGIPVIQSGYVTSGHFVANNYVYVDMEKFREQYRCRVNPKDIIMAKIGANCGRSAVLPENHPQSIIAGNSLKITVNKQYVPELLHELLEYYYAKGRFELIKAVTAQPAISLSNLKKMKIVLMSASEQKRIWEKIDAINKMIMEEKVIYHKLLSTKTGLMQDLLTHKVSVDPLLERRVENE